MQFFIVYVVIVITLIHLLYTFFSILCGKIGKKFLLLLLRVALNIYGRISKRQLIKHTYIKENEKMYMRFLKKHKNTIAGKKWNFENFNSIDDFRSKVPLTEFDEDYVNDIIKNREYGTIGICYTGGTTGKKKEYPINKDYLSIMTKGLIISESFVNCGLFKLKEFRFIKFSKLDTSGELPKGVASAHILSSGSFKKISSLTQVYDFFITESKNFNWFACYFALLSHEKIEFILMTYASVINVLHSTIKDHYLEFIKTMKTGKLPTKIFNSEDESFLKKLGMKNSTQTINEFPSLKNKKVAKFLIRNRFWKKFGELFPKVKKIKTICNGTFASYVPFIKEMFPGVDVISPAYASTEASYGITYNKENQYILFVSKYLFEFIPRYDTDEQFEGYDKVNTKFETLKINQLTRGKNYELVISNRRGSFRLKTGDIIKVVGYKNDTPICEFVGRKNNFLNIFNERVGSESVGKALRDIFKEEKKMEYTCVVYSSGKNSSNYNLFVEIELKKKKMTQLLIDDYADRLDEKLKKIHIGYSVFRKPKKLKKLKLNFVTSGTFDKIKKYKIKNENVSEAQYKPMAILYNSNQKSVPYIELLEKNIKLLEKK